MNKFLLSFLFAFQPFLCLYAANHNGTLGSEVIVTRAQVNIDNPNGEGTLSIKGLTKVVAKDANLTGYAHLAMFISDITVGNKHLQILPVPGANMGGRAIVRAVRSTWLGQSGVLFWFASTGQWFTPTSTAQPGQTYGLDVSFNIRATTAIPAGTTTTTIKLGAEEYFSDSLDSSVLDGTVSFGAVSGINSAPVEITSIGYCTSGNAATTVELNHGVMSADKVDGDSKSADFSYECNTTALPKVYFLTSQTDNLDVPLCDGSVKSSLSLNTTRQAEFSFKTTFNSTLHNVRQNICTGQFSGDAVAVINYN